MRNTFIYIVLAFLSIGVLKATETDAVFKKIKKEHIMHTDGSIEYKYYKELQLLSPYAFNRLYGETFVVYNPEYQKLKIHKSYTIMNDGRKVEAPENAFNIVLPRAVTNYSAYNQMEEMVITHTGLDVGCTIYLEYSVISKPGFIKEMMDTEILSESVPVEDYEVVITVPTRRALKFELMNSEAKAEDSNDGKYRSYKWSFGKIGQQAYEQAAPTNYTTAPTLSFSTFPDIKTALLALNKNKAMNDKLPADLLSKVNSWKKDAKTKMELALNIQKYIVNNISSKHFPLAWHNFILQTPTQVWNANIGNDLEKTILLSKTLQSAGFDAKVMGFVPEKLWHNQIADLANLKHFGVLVQLKGMESFVLSATNNNKRSLDLDYPSSMMMNLETGKVVSLKKVKVGIYLNAQITIDPDNQIFGQLQFKLNGSCFDALALNQDTNSIARNFSNGLPIDKDKKIEASYTGNSNAKFTIPIKGSGEITKQENYYFWRLPQMRNGIAAQHLNAMPIKREFPLVVNAIEEDYEFMITLPKSVEWVEKEVLVEYDESFGKMKVEVKRKDGKIFVKKSLTINPVVIDMMAKKGPMNVHSQKIEMNERTLSLEEYAIFRQMMIDWNSDTANELILKR